MRGKHFSSLLAILVLTLMLAASASAAPPNVHRSPFWANHAPIGQVYFFPQDADVHNGVFHLNPWGLLSYRLWGKQFEFSFNGFNLERRKSYTLVYYPGEGAEMICLSEGISTRSGHLNITAKLNICNLPSAADPNYFYGARIMLVPNGNVSCEEGNFLNPGSEENLISYHPIRFTDTDGCPAPPAPEQPGEEDPSDDEDEPSDPPADPDGSDDTSGGMPY